MIELPQNNRHRKMAKIDHHQGRRSAMERDVPAPQTVLPNSVADERHPSHTVSRWMGHGEKIGDDYIMTDDIFDRVTGLNQPSDKSGAETHCNRLQLKNRPIRPQTKTAAFRLMKVRKTWLKMKWSGAGSNRRHMDFQSIALPTELPDLKNSILKKST